jgi:CBS domain-containing protein
MKARDIMTRNVECVTRDDTAEQAARIMRDEDVGVVPVIDSKGSMKLSGIVTDRDLAVRCIAEGKNGDCRVSEIMSTDLITVEPDDDIDHVMNRMEAEQVRRIPVVEDDRIVGIIAQADLATQGPGDADVGEVVERISAPGGKHRG